MLNKINPRTDTGSCTWPRQHVIDGDPHRARWHVVHNAGAPDKRVEDVLKSVRYEIYYPKTVEMRPIPKRKLPPGQRNSGVPVMRKTLVPLWPRYPLVKFSLYDGVWHEVFESLGVRGVLCDGGYSKPQPAPVDDVYVAVLMASEVNGAIPSTMTAKKLAFEVGERVRINGGVFAGHDALVHIAPDKPLEEFDGSERIKLLVNILGGQSVVELAIGDIEKL